MKLPFTIENFFDVFQRYNISVWPMQIILIIIALVVVYFSISKRVYSNRIVAIGLSFFWLWMGIVYHMIHFSFINKAAVVFGALFILQSIFFLFFGVIKHKLVFHFQANKHGITGIILVAFALLIYPLLGYQFGHIYPSSPTFGVPCPTTIFTFGILLLCTTRIPFIILLIPFFWSIVGFSAAFLLGIKEDVSLLIAAFLSIVMIFLKNKLLKENSANASLA